MRSFAQSIDSLSNTGFGRRFVSPPGRKFFYFLLVRRVFLRHQFQPFAGYDLASPVPCFIWFFRRVLAIYKPGNRHRQNFFSDNKFLVIGSWLMVNGLWLGGASCFFYCFVHASCTLPSFVFTVAILEFIAEFSLYFFNIFFYVSMNKYFINFFKEPR